MKRLHLVAILLLCLLILDETLGGYQKSKKENKKQRKTEGNAREAKKKYLKKEPVKHLRKVQEITIESDLIEEEPELELQESYNIKESQNHYNNDQNVQKYNKDKKYVEEIYTTKDKKFEQTEKRQSKKPKQEKKAEKWKQKRVVIEDEAETEFEQSRLSNAENEFDEACSHCHDDREEENLENGVDIAIYPKKNLPRIHRYIVEEEILDEDDLNASENDKLSKDKVPAKKCYYK